MAILRRSVLSPGVLGLTLALVVLTGASVSAQNLVQNPSFESHSSIPTGYAQLNLANPWAPPTNGSPDYFHALAAGSSGMGVPANDFGNQQPITGRAYAGFHARPVNMYREYVETPLASPLVAGQTYQVSFYVSLADRSQWAVDRIGAYLSVGPVGPVNSAYTLPFIPQVSNPANSYITTKTGWTLVTGPYLAAGGEDHLVIGNFFDNPATMPLTGQGGLFQFAYYYLDDVSVTLVAPQADLGDAPDSTNHLGTTMLTYAVGNFPTVYDPPSPGPAGPLHLDAKGFIWLGKDVTFEDEADMGWDQDPTNNLLATSTPPTADHDLADDGVTSVPLPDCAMTQFPFSATNVRTIPSLAYVNVWFDWTRDGDWDDVPRCAVAPSIDAIAAEWAVQNHVVTLAPGFNPALMTPPFRSINPSTGKPVWMRITLTDGPINAANHGGPFPNPADVGRGGSGPLGGYQFGETEDYLLDVKSGNAEICVLKFHDLDRDGVRDPGEPGLPGWTIIISYADGKVATALTTGDQGIFSVGVPAPATYRISEVPQSGWRRTYPAPAGTHTVTVSTGQLLNVSFGNTRTPRWLRCLLRWCSR